MPDIYAKWYDKNTNWGDAVNPYLIEKLSGRKPVNMLGRKNWFKKTIQRIRTNPREEYTVIGSLINWGHWKDNVSVIWGAGFMTKDGIMSKKPKRVCAVRGPKTREKLLNIGIDCPRVYGDPGLIAALLLRDEQPVHSENFKIGIIPHYTELDNPVIETWKSSEVDIISPLLPLKEFIVRMQNCECIASSSLHGIIAADALKKPNVRLKMSNKVTGGDFKYEDYFLGTRNYPVHDNSTIVIHNKVRVKDLIDCCKEYNLYDFSDPLYSSCPFLKSNYPR